MIPPPPPRYSASGFGSVKGLGMASMVLVGICGAISVIQLFAEIGQLRMLQEMQGGVVNRAAAEQSDLNIGILNLVWLLVFIVSVIVYLIWINRAYKNLPALGHYTAYTPGWAVGYHFVPFLNLVRVPQVMSELFGFSQTGGEPSTPLVGVWWGSWIIGGILTRMSAGSTMGEQPSLDTLVNATYMSIAAEGLAIVSAIALVALINKVSAGQEQSFAAMKASAMRQQASGGYGQRGGAPHPGQPAYPAPGYPQQSYPQQGYPQQPYPAQQGYPQQGYPQPVYPPQSQAYAAPPAYPPPGNTPPAYPPPAPSAPVPAAHPSVPAPAMANVDDLLRQGMALAESGDWAQASQVFAEVVRQVPGNSAGRFQLARAHARQGNREAALEQYNALKTQDPQLASVLYSEIPRE